MTATARRAHVCVRNTFIHLGADDTDADWVALRTQSGTPLRAESDPIGRNCAAFRYRLKLSQFDGAAVHDDLPRGVDVAAESERLDFDEEDENADGPLQRTFSYAPSSQGAASEHRVAGLDPKSSFLHVDDDTDADVERLCPPMLAVREENVEDEDATLELKRFSTYDPFAPCEYTDDGDTLDVLERLETFDPFGAPDPTDTIANSVSPGPFPINIPTISVAAMPLLVGVPLCAFQPFPYHLAGLQGPTVGGLHSFHKETDGFGTVSHDYRQFTKGECYEGRLSVLSESKVHTGGVHNFLVQFSGGELTKADGVGFVFSSRLPCTKNIQKIVSIFVNRSGQICMRAYGYVVRGLGNVRTLKIGDWVELAVDLDTSVATFRVWPEMPNPNGKPDSSAEVAFGKKLGKAAHKADLGELDLHTGHFACVVQNVGVTVTIGS